jgi:hypothetical protein
VFSSHRRFSSLPHRSLPCLYQWPSNAEDRIIIWHRDSLGILSLLLRFVLVGLAEVVVPVWTALRAISSENKDGEEGGGYLWIQANVLIAVAAFQTCGCLSVFSDKASCQRDKTVVKHVAPRQLTSGIKEVRSQRRLYSYNSAPLQPAAQCNPPLSS